MNLKELSYNLMKGAGAFLGVLLFIQSITMLCAFFLGANGYSTPWTLITLLRLGFYKELALSFLVVSFLCLAGFSFWCGGIKRIIATYAINCILFATIGLVFGYLIFDYWQGYETKSMTQALSIVRSLEAGTIEIRRFIFSLMVGFLLPSLLIVTKLRDRFSSETNALGNAHFASGFEVKKAGFLDKTEESIIIGKKYGVPLFSNGFEHVLVFAPTGSGKTRSIGIPNLLNYPYSVVCNDVKLSMFEKTSGFREKVLGHKCFCWAPAKADGKTHRFNPLSFISDDKIRRLTDIQRIAHILIPDSKKSDPIWSQASRKLFKALTLYLLDTPEQKVTLGEINRLVKQDGFDLWLNDVLEKTEHYDPEFYRNGFSYINNHDKTRSSILESFTGYFELFDDPTIDAATSKTDFDIRDLRKEKMTVYVGFTDDDMERLSPILTLFWQQLMSSMIQEVPNLEKEPYPLLCLIDEFSSLGRIERLRRSLKLLREYRVRCVLMLQYIGQTYEQYSHDEAKAFTNIKTKIAFATDDYQDAEYISKLLGTRTKRVNTGSSSSQQNGHSHTKSYNYQAIPLLRPEEVSRLSDQASLIMRTGNSPVKARQYVWYRESEQKSLPIGESYVPTQQANISPYDHKEKRKRILERQGDTEPSLTYQQEDAVINVL